MEEKEKYTVRRTDLLHPELSFKINRILFDVHNEIGGGHPEKYYQQAVKYGFEKANISFTEQYYVPLCFKDKVIGKYFLDFLVENSVILELKRGKYISNSVIFQTKQYLQALNLSLAIIGCFSYDAMVTKRILNQY